MKMRVSAVQYQLHDITSFDEFAHQCEHYVKNALEYGAEFVLFPEFFTTQLLSMNNKDGKPLSINELPDFTEQYKALFETLAKENKIHIIAGTHVINRDGRLYNVAHLFYPDGRVEEHKDRKSISSWATEAVTALNQAGIMNGRANGQFDPKATVTRAEVATVIHR